jgi:hypothetical protein
VQAFNNGADLHSAFVSAETIGLCDDSLYNFDPAHVQAFPPPAAYDSASGLKLTEYQWAGVKAPEVLQNWKELIAAGYPIAIAMQVTPQFETLSASDTYTGTATGAFLDNHAMCIIGYDEAGFIVENSWGTVWCDQGCFHLPNDVAVRDVFQAWAITGITGVNIVPITTRNPQEVSVYLTPNSTFTINDECNVYGNTGSSIILAPSARNVMMDSNVQSVHTSVTQYIMHRQQGNELEIYSNGTLLAAWCIAAGSGQTLDGMPVALNGAVMTLGGRVVSTDTPT